MKTLKLFNAVLHKDTNSKPFISKEGFIISSGAIWSKDEIVRHLLNEKLSGNDLNKTFHKSWKTIQESSRFELLQHQILHYISTYGSDFKDEVYIPNEVLDLEGTTLKYKVINSYTKEEFIDKALGLLKSGIALKEETVNDLISLLVDELDYKFTGDEGIKNKEAIVKIAELYNVFPKNNVEFFRYIIYRTTGETLLIKNDNLISKIKSSNFNPSQQFKDFGLDNLSEIFNRFKPLFLGFKDRCPKTINKLSKLSKKNHKPLVQNPLNNVTSIKLEESDLHWLENATIFSLFKALQALYSRIYGQNTFMYRIRNGKSWLREKQTNSENLEHNFNLIMDFMKSKYSLNGKSFYLPSDVKYALPTSEKMFVGNIPTGTKFLGDNLAVGIYWENEWGATDLDLSAINIDGKVGWNSSYNQNNNLLYSGDITSAPNGAVEYLYAKDNVPTSLVRNNVFRGNDNCDYKIVIGKGDNIDRNYMMNPSKLFAEVKCQSVQKQTILGIFSTGEFTILNFGEGHLRVSTGNSEKPIEALMYQWSNPLTFNWMVSELGGIVKDTEKDVDYNFSLDNLQKDSFLIFK